MSIPEFGLKRENEERRDGGCGIVYDPQTKKFAVGEQHDTGMYRLFSGGVDVGEDIEQGVVREVKEESGLYDFARIEKVAEAMSHYRNDLRNVNRVAHATCFLIVVNSTKTEEVHLEAHEKFSLVWVTEEELLKNWSERNQNKDLDHWVYFFSLAKEKLGIK
ncbi:MAG: NUDIX domain-containing protein [Candidatus Pacebacteria bacterium]|jgi:8-oxo-dGTP pyrophosphatase MutT (NUDIX family)|nr:NUDIX domain-containing protein [Candidatus Paceibacterota bacterium]